MIQNPMTFTQEEVASRKAYLDFTDEDASRIREASPYLKSVAKKLADAFYDHLSRFGETAALIKGRVEDLKKTQATYFEQMLDANVDPRYTEVRAQVGRVHERIGLKPKWYIGAFSLYEQMSARLLREDAKLGKDPLRAWDIALSLSKLIFYDIGITIDVYIDTLVRTVKLQEEALRELSAPVIEVWDEVLVLPLVGTMDTRRSQEVTEALLNAVVAKRARVVIIDITGLPVMDTSTANHLFKTVQAVELLGTVAIVTGVRPAIAQTVVSLGIDTSQLRTQARLVDGLKLALEMTGRAVSEVRQDASEGES